MGRLEFGLEVQVETEQESRTESICKELVIMTLH